MTVGDPLEQRFLVGLGGAAVNPSRRIEHQDVVVVLVVQVQHDDRLSLALVLSAYVNRNDLKPPATALPSILSRDLGLRRRSHALATPSPAMLVAYGGV